MESPRMGRFSALITISVLLAACGGGGGGGGSSDSDPDDDPGNPGGSSNGRLQMIEATASGLLAHNPASPGSTTTLDASADFSNVNSIPVLGATWNNGQTDNGYIQELVYQDTNGHIMRVSTDASNGVMPSPQRVSYNSATASGFNIGQDFADVNNASVAFRNDSTGDWWWTKLGWDESIKPKPFPGKPLVDLVDPADGSHDGWLALDAGEIKYRDPDPAVTATTVPGSPSGISAAAHLESIQTGKVMLNIDGGLWVYEPGSGLTDLGHSFTHTSCFTGPSSCPVLHVVDDAELFFIDNNRLYGTDLTSNQVDPLDENTSPASISLSGRRLAVGTNRVVWSYTTDPTPNDALNDDEKTVINSLTKDGQNAIELHKGGPLAPGLSARNQPFLDRAGEWFFYTLSDGTSTPTAVAVKMDNSASETLTGAAWMGVSTNLISFTALEQSLKRVYLADGLTSPSQLANTNLKSVAPSSPGSPLPLGTIPADAQSFGMIGAFGIQRLAFLTTDDGSGDEQQDVLYLDGNTSGSLQRITDTATEDETPSPFF